MEYDLDTCPKCVFEEELAAVIDILNQTRDERDLFASQRNASNREIEKLHDELETVRKDTIRQVVNYLKLMHDMTPNTHNYYLVAANLIAGEFGENTEPKASTE